MSELAVSVESQCEQLSTCMTSLHFTSRNARGLSSIAKDVDRICQEVGLGADDNGEPHLRLLQHLSAAQVNTSLVARSVRSLQRDLPRALTALQTRIASADSASPTAADDLEELYADLAQLDAQGLLAAATLESSHHSGSGMEVSSSSRAASVRVAMQHIASELRSTWTQLRTLMLTHMRRHSRLAHTCPQLLVRCAQLAEVHDAAASALREQSVRSGIMHATDEEDGTGDGASLASLCAAAVRHAYKEQCDAALLVVSAEDSTMALDDAEAVQHALARADAVLLSCCTFNTVSSKCFPPRWNLAQEVAAITTDAVVHYLRALAASASSMSNDSLLQVLAWVDAVEPAKHPSPEDSEPVVVVVSTQAGPVQQWSNDGPFALALRPVRDEYLRRCGDALRRWVANILAHCAPAVEVSDAGLSAATAPPPPQNLISSSAVSLSSAPVDIFRLIHEQQAVVASSGAAARLVAPLAFLHLDILDGYAASLAAQHRSVVRDAKGDLAVGAMEKLLTTCNDSYAAARNAEDHFHSFLEGAAVPDSRPSTASSMNSGFESESHVSVDMSPCATPTSVLSATAQPFARRGASRRTGSGDSSGGESLWSTALGDGGAAAEEYRIRERVTALVSAFDAVARGCVYRLSEVMFWDVESVLWRCFSPDRWAKNNGAMPSPLRSALATLDDYIGDLTMALLPPLMDALLTECTKRAAVTYAAMLFVGPPLVSCTTSEGGGAAPPLPPIVPDDIAQAARLCIASDVDALRSHLSRLRAPAAVLEAAAEMLTVACELATSTGSATATRIVTCIRQEYGFANVPAQLLNRILSVGVWSPFAQTGLTFSDTPPGGESTGLGSILPAAAAVLHQMQAPLLSAMRKAGARRLSVTWAANATEHPADDGDDAASAVSPSSARPSQSTPRKSLLRRNALTQSFNYIDEDTEAMNGSGGELASAAAFKASFFHRVEALCAKRAIGARPRDTAGADAGEYCMSADVTGPWARLGALKRRATLWPWSSGGATQDDSAIAATTQGPKETKGLARRKTLFF